MAFLTDKSCECMHGQLDLFAVPPTQTSIQSARWSEYLPISTIQGNTPLEFVIEGSGDDYLDLSSVMLYVRTKITQLNGDDLEAASDAAPINLLLHSLFCQVDVSLNNVLISSSTSTYAYRSYIETLLTYGSDAKKSQFSSELYYRDDPGRFNAVNREVQDGHHPNSGLQKRRGFMATSREIDLIGRLHCDIFHQQKHLLNEISLKLKLIRSSNEFVLMGANARLVITHAAIYARKIKLTPSIFLAHAKALESNNANYYMKRVVCKSIAIAQGLRDSQIEKVFTGQVPTRVVIGLVNNAAYNGTIDNNPFLFHHYDLTEANIFVDGQLEGTSKSIVCNFGANQFVRAYNSLFAGTGKLFNDEGIDISREDYANGYTLIAWDLTADGADDDHLNLIKSGSVRLSLKFANALPHTISCIVYGEFESLLTVDKHRQIVTDFTV